MRMKVTLAILLTGCLLVPPLWSRVHSQRGQGVRIKSENGQEIDLYAESHALVIGVRKYASGWRELPGAEKDAEAISAVLRRQGFAVTVALNPTKAQLDEALTTFISERGLQERNRLLVYFAGHGYTEVFADGRELGYIIPADAPLPERDPQLFNRRAISMDEIEAKALRIRSKHALFVFDSCFSGSIFDGRGERYVPPEIESKTAAPVRMFITAGTKNQTVPDDSIFRLYFVRAFEQREGDLNRDGFITGEELGMYLAGRVASDSRDTQTPRYGKIKNALLNLGDIVFALPRREVPTPGLDPAAIELAMWQSADRSNELADYEEYLRQYPQGRFAGMAHNRSNRLRAAGGPTSVSGSALPVGISKWVAQIPGRNGQTSEAIFNFKAEGNMLTGSMSSASVDIPISYGKISGDDVTFTVAREFQGNTVELLYKGKVSGDEIKFTRTRKGGDQPGLEFTAKRARMSVAGVPLVVMNFTTAQVNERGEIVNRRQEQCWGYFEDLGNGVKLEMVEIPAGEFLMGEDAAWVAEAERECRERSSDSALCNKLANWATPQHRVQVSGFLMGKYEVTQRQWKAVMGSLPLGMEIEGEFKGDDLPVLWVSWDEAQTFLQRLGKGYRLPSEAEWEYAARAGTRTAYAFGPTISTEVANYNNTNYPRSQAAKGGRRPVAVGSLGLANAWGLFDMHGNVWEWCEDNMYDSYRGAPTNGRAWVDISSTGLSRVIRGGSWSKNAKSSRSAYRNGHPPGVRYGHPPGVHFDDLGLRLVRR